MPAGYRADQRGVPGGFVGDPDIMDTWATSSLTPFIVCGWETRSRSVGAHVPDGPASAGARHHPHVAVLDRAALASREDALPWKHAAISGWVLDPDRKKMSKSKGNVVTPMALLEEHGSDAVRYWAAKGGPGVDTAFEPGQMKVGRRLAIKLLNASKFVLVEDGRRPGRSPRCSIAACCSGWRASSRRRREHLDAYDYAAALRETEEFFWWFCDDYIELVKRRRAGDDAAGGLGGRRVPDRAVGAAAAVRAVPAVRHRRGLVVVAGGSVHRARVADGRRAHGAARRTAESADVAARASGVGDHREDPRRAVGAEARLRRARPRRAGAVAPSIRPSGASIERDVLAGNNVVAADVDVRRRCDSRSRSTPQPADA